MQEQDKKEVKRYEPPQIIYEGEITTRAGSPLGGGDGNGADGVDPADLFSE